MPAVTRSATKKQTARNRRAQRRQQQDEPVRQPQRRRRDNRQEENEDHVHVREERTRNQHDIQQEIFDPFEEHQQEPPRQHQQEPPRQHQQEPPQHQLDEHQQEGIYGPRHMHPLVYQFLQYRKHRPKPHFQPQGFFCGSPNNANGRPLGSPYQCLRKGFGASSSSFIRDLDSFFNEMGL